MTPTSYRRPWPPSWFLKVTMAITGTIWTLFVLIHLFGNLKVFSGPASFNSYAHWLTEALYPFLPAGFLLWAFRLILIVSLVGHVYAAAVLWGRSRRARGARSVRWRSLRGGFQSVAAKLMPLTGVVVLVFLVVHILDLTVGAAPVAPNDFAAASPSGTYAYQNLIHSLGRPAMAAFYLLVMILLSIHVAHGAVLVATDLGAMGARLRAAAVWVGAIAGLAILVGNGAIPICVQLGVLT